LLNSNEKSQNLKQQPAKFVLFFMRTFLFFGENYKGICVWDGAEMNREN
jgi:hypothetical protein